MAVDGQVLKGADSTTVNIFLIKDPEKEEPYLIDG
jgi:hypothetical protein